jgi:Mrp family chromosome partitioning ATPase
MSAPKNIGPPATDETAAAASESSQVLSRHVRHGSSLQSQKASRELIARMEEPFARRPGELEALGVIHQGAKDPRRTDAFRDLRTQLLAHGLGRNFVILVAPVTPQCGGSLVALNLAAAFAFDESKTALLIDCNLRQPMLHEHLGVRVEHGGLTDLLEESTTEVESIIYPTGIARLRLIPAGRRREASAEYFTSYRMRGLIDALRSRYPDRYVVLAAPPVSRSPDARILSELADTAVVVAGYGCATTSAIRDATAVLEPARLAGIVFNQVP